MKEDKKNTQTDGIDTPAKLLTDLIAGIPIAETSELYNMCSKLGDIYTETIEPLTEAFSLYKEGYKRNDEELMKTAERKIVKTQNQLSRWVEMSKVEITLHPNAEKLKNIINLSANKCHKHLNQIGEWIANRIPPSDLDLLALECVPTMYKRIVKPLKSNPFVDMSDFRNLLVAECLVTADEEEIKEKILWEKIEEEEGRSAGRIKRKI